jgi:hypothetical protein
MDIFISWSGRRSGAVARALHGWLPQIINEVEPWLSSADIDKGARWHADIAARLQAAKAGIICVTPSNLHSDWILFEAGALSKTLDNTFVCPFLIGIEPTDVKGPLAQFEATRTTGDDVLRMLKTLNELAATPRSDARLEEAFEVWWPRLEAQFAKLPPDEPTARPHRTDRDLIEEILDLVRNQNRPAAPVALPERGPDGVEEITDEVIRVARTVDPGISGINLARDGTSLYFLLRGPKRSYPLEVPGEALLSDVEAIVRGQLPSA